MHEVCGAGQIFPHFGAVLFLHQPRCAGDNFSLGRSDWRDLGAGHE